MSDRKAEVLAEIAAALTRLAELALEAKALGLTGGEMEAALGPVFEKFEGAFDD